MAYTIDNAIMDLMYIHRELNHHITDETMKKFDACIALSITALQNYKDASGDDGCVDS